MNHLNNLQATLGTDQFDAAFAAIQALPATELAAIASAFVSRTSKSAPKRESLRRIYARHASLIDSDRKRALQSGKSAA
jgi:hypothetical protein